VESERLEGETWLPVLGGRTKPCCTWGTAAGEDDDAGFGLFVIPCDCLYKGTGDRGVKNVFYCSLTSFSFHLFSIKMF